MREIVLVDGVGRPQLREVPDDEPPGTFGLARPYVDSGPDRLVIFVRTAERDADGHVVYRQRGVYAPEIRWRYLSLSPILFNPPHAS